MTTTTKIPLFENQKQSVKFFNKIKQGLDFSDPGTGKTRTQIELFKKRRAKGSGCALVIAPKSLLYAAWYADIKKFAPELSVCVVTAANRKKQLDVDADIYITNTDATRWLSKLPKTWFTKFETLIVDEISMFKHRTSLRSRCLNKIKSHFTYRYGLTGTPNSNTILDVWNQTFVIDDGERLGKSFFAYRSNVTTPVQVGPLPSMVDWKEKEGSRKAVADVLADITVRHKFEDCQSIPANHMYQVYYDLTDKQMDHYKDMIDFAVSEIKQGSVVNAVNAASLITKLLQIASGAVYDINGNAQLLDTDRYELVLDLIKARDHSLVFFNWKHQRDYLCKLCDTHKIPYTVIDGDTSDAEKRERVEQFQRGYFKVCFAHPQSAAHGLTLTRATSTIWCSPTYNLEFFTQGNRRIYRAGQTNKTETICIVGRSTLENKVYKKLAAKEFKQTDFLDTVKELLA